jgi:hypothetical protein
MPTILRSAIHGKDADFLVGVLVITGVGTVVVVVSGRIVAGGVEGGTGEIVVVGTSVPSVNRPGWSV